MLHLPNIQGMGFFPFGLHTKASFEHIIQIWLQYLMLNTMLKIVVK
jgi:hypothetical protein